MLEGALPQAQSFGYLSARGMLIAASVLGVQANV